MEEVRHNAESVKREAMEARAAAQHLLEQLTAELKELTKGGEVAGKDLYKQVTGQSSLERAVEETRRMIACYDRILEQASKPEAEVVVRRLNWQPHGVAV